MPDHTIIEIHVKGPPEIAAKAADKLMTLAQARGYVVRVNEAVQGIQQGDGWFALDCGAKGRVQAEGEISRLIYGINAGDCLKVGEFDQSDSN
jgi:hypothetical protein